MSLGRGESLVLHWCWSASRTEVVMLGIASHSKEQRKGLCCLDGCVVELFGDWGTDGV